MCYIHQSNLYFISTIQGYKEENKNPNNPYQVLAKCKEFGLVHDATTKELNTIFIRVVGKDGTIFKVAFSFDRVLGSFTGEALCEELIQKISQ